MATFVQIDLAAAQQKARCLDCGRTVEGLAAMMTHRLECRTGTDELRRTEHQGWPSHEVPDDDASDLRW